MNRKTPPIKTMRRRTGSYLKWVLSAISAVLTTSFVVMLEVEA